MASTLFPWFPGNKILLIVPIETSLYVCLSYYMSLWSSVFLLNCFQHFSFIQYIFIDLCQALTVVPGAEEAAVRQYIEVLALKETRALYISYTVNMINLPY